MIEKINKIEKVLIALKVREIRKVIQIWKYHCFSKCRETRTNLHQSRCEKLRIWEKNESGIHEQYQKLAKCSWISQVRAVQKCSNLVEPEKICKMHLKCSGKIGSDISERALQSLEYERSTCDELFLITFTPYVQTRHEVLYKSSF